MKARHHFDDNFLSTDALRSEKCCRFIHITLHDKSAWAADVGGHYKSEGVLGGALYYKQMVPKRMHMESGFRKVVEHMYVYQVGDLLTG